jgi:hypothetical protein
MRSKISFILLKFLQSINLKKKHEYKTIYINDKSNFKKLILLLMKITPISISLNLMSVRDKSVALLAPKKQKTKDRLMFDKAAHK